MEMQRMQGERQKQNGGEGKRKEKRGSKKGNMDIKKTEEKQN